MAAPKSEETLREGNLAPNPGDAEHEVPGANRSESSPAGRGARSPEIDRDLPAIPDASDPMATVADHGALLPSGIAVNPIDPTESDPFATRVGPALPPSVPGRDPASDINPIPSGVHSFEKDRGPVPTPNLSPPSSIDLPSLDLSSDLGSDLPRFDPNATPGVEILDQKKADPQATFDSSQLAATEADPNATAMPDLGHHDPMVTSAMGHAVTQAGYGSGASIGFSGLPGTSSSRFRIMRAHARGGLGSVLVAFDEELRREVALKEIQDRHADNPDSRARFLLEAEITGGLEHPGVVPVYSLGRNPDGRPFYAMRFIRGDSLRKAIEHFHDPEHGPTDPGERSLQLRALLKRFLDVCNALEYSHSRGVIHRDIKPDNIMLGPYGETLVVDWGLAKAMDRVDIPSRTEEMPLRPLSVAGSTPTLDGSAIGTPAFMSPEQAEGDLARMGPVSDVYSLGATLYQILTGVPPFTERNLYQVLVKVRNGEFPHPREIKPEIPPALEAICLSAMARSTEDRYASCRALADDLEHWLADEPVSVYREPFTVRLGRWAKRHRTLVTGAGVLLITAVVGLSIGALLIEQERARTEAQRQSAVAGWNEARENEAEAKAQGAIADQNAEQARTNETLAIENARLARENEETAKRNEQLAQQNAERADAQRRIAERNFGEAIAAVDSLLTEVGEIDLADVPQMEQTRRDLLLKAQSFYEQFLQQNDSPETRRDAGRARSRLGDIHELLGEYDEARASYDAALTIQEPLAEANPDDPELAADLARTRHNLAILLKKLNDFEESESLLDQARAARAGLLERSPDDLGAKSDLAASIYQLGAVLARLVGRQPEARTLYDTAIDMQRGVVAARGELEEDRRELARYLNNLALLLQGTDPKSANATFEESITLQRRLSEENSDVPHYSRELARTLNNQVREAIVNDPETAEAALREAIALAEQLTADYPSVPDYWSELGGYLSNLGQALTVRGAALDDQAVTKEAEALFLRASEAYRRSERIRTQLVAEYPSRPEYRHRLALIRQNLARFLRGRHLKTDAIPVVSPSIPIVSSGIPILESSIGLLRNLVEENPSVPEYRKDLARALVERASTVPFTSEGFAQAMSIAEEGLSFADSAARDRPEDLIFWDTQMSLHQLVGTLDVKMGRQADALSQARFLGENARVDATWLYKAAALSLDSTQPTGDLDPTAQERQISALDQAARLLQQAAGAGYSQVEQAESKFKAYLDRTEIKDAIELIRAHAKIDR